MAKLINFHHIVYADEKHPNQEWIVPMFKGEHNCITKISWYTRKDVSLGFITALEEFIVRNKHRAIDLARGEKP